MMGSFDRDKHLKPLLAAGLVILLLSATWAYSSYKTGLTSLDRKIANSHQKLEEFENQLQDYRKLKQQLENFRPTSRPGKQKNLISTVEDAAQKIDARGQLIYVRPQPDKKRDDLTEEGVEIRLEKLQLNQLVELLYQFENSKDLLKTSQLRIRTRFDNAEQLDAVLVVNRFREQR